MSKELIIVALADIHFGAFDSDILYDELYDNFIQKIKKLEYIDMIVLPGDVYDTKISMNSNHAKQSIKFIKEVVEICKEKECKLRIIKGTHSHDNNQLDALSLYIKDIDFKLFNAVDKEEFDDGTKILYVPEEYVNNFDEHYGEFFKEEYDIIVGHGMVDVVSFVSHIQTSENTMSKAPIFKSDDLLKICRGPVILGHIHKHMKIKNRIFYVGSFSRWCFGEEEEKGFMVIRYNKETYELLYDFILNSDARLYNTIELTYTESLLSKDISEQIKTIVETVKECHSDYIRLKLILPSFVKNAQLVTEVLTETFSKYKKIALQIINLSKITKEEETKEKINIIFDRFKFLFESNIPYTDKISKYIKIKYNKNIPIKNIERYLTELK